MKYFTVEEAQALIPRLEEVFVAALPIHGRAQAKAKRVMELESGAAEGAADLAIERAQLQFLVNAMNECLQKIAELGAIPKGVEPALVDFPHRLQGREVYLCWKLGEKSVSHYHGIEEGFSGRKPLPRSAYST